MGIAFSKGADGDRGRSVGTRPNPKPAKARARAKKRIGRRRRSIGGGSGAGGAPFASLAIDPALKKAIAQVFGYERMSEQQSAYIPAAVDKKAPSMLVRARTGSGKTLGFLLPVIQRALEAGPGARALVLAPARELAMQTAEEARKLTTFLRDRIGVALVMGDGGASDGAVLKMIGERATIVIGTPGRTTSMLGGGKKSKNGPVNKAISDAFRSDARVLVLDEADTLLDVGFLHDVKDIANKHLGHDRQTLMFSATSPPHVTKAADALMAGRPYQTLDTGSASNAGTNAARNVNIAIESMIVPPAHGFAALRALLERERATNKTIVFVQTAMMAALVAQMLPNVIEMHSRLGQAKRTAATARFREAGVGSVMVASDVLARGVSFDDVTLVIQLGIAADSAQVVHRSGRTGRGVDENGQPRKGRSLIILGADETKALDALKHLEIRAVQPPPAANRGHAIELGPDAIRTACRAFVATVGFYNGQMRRLGWKGPETLAKAVVDRFSAIKQVPDTCPPVPEKTLRKMGLPKDLKWT